MLDELGCTGFPKTSGDRGVHVYVRDRAALDVHRGAPRRIAFGRELERRSPTGSPPAGGRRSAGERVFVDYNQNARDRTIASAYVAAAPSPRRPVSTPLTWDELPEVAPDGLHPADGPGAGSPSIGDPHAAIDDVAHDLTPLLEWYERDDRDEGLEDLPYPPDYPKMPGEPTRVQPSRAKSPDEPAG